jgi:hypothetical protein
VGGGGWLLRAAGGFTGRANSALATGDPGMPLADAVGEVCRWYTVRGLPALVSLAYPSEIRTPTRWTGSSPGAAGRCAPARQR